ncbi:MAG: DUF4369 domain-containing protein [Rikenellaceae bacterium]
MKLKNFTLFPLALIALCSCSPRPEGYSISGTADGFEGKIYLEEINDYGYPTRIDTAVIEDSKFHFSGKLSEPSVCNIVDFPRGKRVLSTVVIDNNTDIEIKLTSTKEGVVESTYSKASENFVREKFQERLSRESTYQQRADALDELILNNPSAIYSAFALFQVYNTHDQISKLRELASHLKSPAAESKYTKIVLDRANVIEKSAVGQKFTDFTTAYIGGKPVSLSKFAGKGKWTLLYFCNCFANSYYQAKHVVNAHQKYMNKGAGVEVFVHTSDELQTQLYKTIDDIYGIGDNAKLWHFTSDLKSMDGEAIKQYGIMNVPYGILISPDGTITEHINTYQIAEIESIFAKHIK